MSDAADRIEGVVEHAAETAASIVEGAQLDAAAVIAAAEERIEEAEEAAEVLAQAALMTNLGGMVRDLKEGFSQWQTASAADLLSLRTELETVQQEIAALKQAPSLLIQQPSQTSIQTDQPSLPDQVEPILEAAIVTPLKVLANADDLPEAPAPKRSRWT